jgi:hypothetical protein
MLNLKWSCKHSNEYRPNSENLNLKEYVANAIKGSQEQSAAKDAIVETNVPDAVPQPAYLESVL